MTRLVFSATTEVITLAPYTPCAENALRSACIPAPPEQSDPAIVKHFFIIILSLILFGIPILSQLVLFKLFACFGFHVLVCPSFFHNKKKERSGKNGNAYELRGGKYADKAPVFIAAPELYNKAFDRIDNKIKA